MSYTIRNTFQMGPSKAGKSLRGQIVNDAGSNIGSEITTASELTGGLGVFEQICTIPDGQEGFLRIYFSDAPTVFVASIPLNPQEIENSDVKTSTRLSSGSYTAPDNAGVAAIKAKTDNLPVSPAATGDAMTLANGAITAAAIATDAIDADAIAASAVSEIQSGLATSSALSTVDGNVSAIKAKTDSLPTDPADQSAVEAAITAATSGLSTLTTTDIDNRLAAYDAATGAEAATISTAIAALNDLSSSEAQAAAAAALTAYDPPTKTEMDTSISTATSGLSTLTTSDIPTASVIASAVWAAGTRTLTGFGTLVADIWAYLVSSITTSGSIGKRIVDNLDAQVSGISGGGGGGGITIEEAQQAAEDALAAYGAATSADVASVAATVAAQNARYKPGEITIYQSATAVINMTGVTIIPSNISRGVFTVKLNVDDADEDAILKIDSDDGLLVLNGAVPDSALDASLVYSYAAKTVDVVVADHITAEIATNRDGYYYDFKAFRPTSASAVTGSGRFKVLPTVTKEV